jgi:hypothetical protein
LTVVWIALEFAALMMLSGGALADEMPDDNISTCQLTATRLDGIA